MENPIHIKVLYWKVDKIRKYCTDGEIPTPEEISSDYMVVWEANVDEKSELINCERLYSDFNEYDMIGQIRAEEVGHTSMSIGDVVTIGELIYICTRLGFKLIYPDTKDFPREPIEALAAMMKNIFAK